MIVVGLDFETRSLVDLKVCGVDNYATDPSTDIICCSFINKDSGHRWLWYAGTKLPADLVLCLQMAGEIEAHNARFDQLIYECVAVNDYGFPVLDKTKWVCTAAQCRVNALPASLDAATRAIDAKHKKDHSGSGLIKKLSIPNIKGEFNQDPKLIEKMGLYCMRDSLAMVDMTGKLRELSVADKLDWQTNERINDAGMLVDIELAALAQKYAVEEKEELGVRLERLTDGHIDKVTQTARLLKVLITRFAPQSKLLKCITKAPDKTGIPKYTLDKAARSQLLANPDLKGNYREIVELIDQGGNTSVSKFSAMLNRADPLTGRVHGAFIFAGAGQTQRYSSKGLQLHNMRRDCWGAEEAEELKDIMRVGGDIAAKTGLSVMDTLARLLRPTIIPAKGHKFIVGDWSAIEARVLPWLSGSAGGELALQVFRDGVDVYVQTAINMGLEKEDRQIGKVANLSLGFGGGVGAFQAMATNYGLTLPDDQVQGIVNMWREANTWAKKFWHVLELASVNAVQNPLEKFCAGRVEYIFLPKTLGGTLMAILPNSTVIQYPYAKIEGGCVTAMKASVQPPADSTYDWPRMSLWGGFLAENNTQATAACLLREVLSDMVGDGFPVVGHVHDEVILEVMDCEVEQTLLECQDYMEAVPEWANGLPLNAEPVIMSRYGK